MKKFIFFLALIFLAGVGYVGAQNLVAQNQETLSVNVDEITRTETRADFELSYSGGAVNSFGGYNHAAGTSYVSACISFTAGQMANYVGTTLTAIETFIPQLTQAPNNFMAGWTAYRIWIKTALNGAIVYEQDVTSNVTLDDWNVFTLNTPYTITGPLVIGYTVTFNLASAGSRFAMPFENVGAPYCSGSFYAMYSTTNANAHGTGAVFGLNTGRAAAIFGHVNGTILANDLCAVSLASPAIKLVNTPHNFGVWVFNAGTVPQNNFTVQLLNAADAVIGSTTVTNALAPGAHRLVNVSYTTPSTTGLLTVKGKVVLTGDQIPSNDLASEQLTQRIYAMQPMGYCTYAIENGIGPSTPPSPGSAAISYTAANMAPFVGKVLTAIDLGISPGGSISNGVIWIRNARDGANLYSQPFTPVDGWNFVTLNTPYELTSANTFIGYTIDIAAGNVMGATNNTQISGVNHLAIGATWYNMNQVTTTGNMTIIGAVSDPSTNVTITTAVNPVGAGSVTGGGNYAVGAPVTLTASANANYAFVNWTPGGSTANPLTFNATENATYTANFQSTLPGDCNPATNLDVVYNPNCSATLTWTAPIGKSAQIIDDFYSENYLIEKKENRDLSESRRNFAASMSKTRKIDGNHFSGDDNSSRAAFDLLWHFNADAVLGAGGNFSPFLWEDKLYIARWNPSTAGNAMGRVNRYARSGNTWVSDGNITIPGIPNYIGVNIEGFCTDGQFIYAANGSPIIYKINPATWTVVGTINTTLEYVDGIAYDAVQNCFWVAEYYWDNAVYKIPLTGGAPTQTLYTSGGIYGISDIAWENSSDGTPYLWMLAVDDENINLHRWNLTTGAFTVNAKLNTSIPGIDVYGDGAGLFTGFDPVLNKNVMIGLIEGVPEKVFCYELSDNGEPPVQVAYNIYRDGAPIATNITATTYTDNGFDYDQGHTWQVKVACEAGGESAAVSKTMPACPFDPDACQPPSNLTGEYTPMCEMVLTWQPPVSKNRNTITTPTIPFVETEPNPNYVEITEAEKIALEQAALITRANNDVHVRKSSITQKEDEDYNPRATWDILYNYNYSTLTPGMLGVFYWNGKVYGSRWNPSATGNAQGKVYRYNISGNTLTPDGDFIIPGITGSYNIEDWTTDGTHIYGANETGKIYKIDPATWTVASQINVPIYDVAPLAYCKATGGFWIAEMFGTSVTLVTSTGGTTGTTLSGATQGIMGLAYDDVTPGGPYVWAAVGSGASSFAQIGRWKVGVNTFTLIKNVAPDFPLTGTGHSMGGIFTYEVGGFLNLLALSQGQTQIIGYELAQTGTPCPAVSNVQAINPAGTTNVNVTWTAATGNPTGYEVSRNGVVQATVTTTSYSQTNLPQGSYTYCVKAIYPPANDCIPQSVCAAPVTVPEILTDGCEGRIVGTGTTAQNNLPLNTFYGNSWVQQIFDASEIGDAGVITQIAFNFINTTPFTRTNQTIYLGHTTKSTFSSTTDWIPVSQLTPVFTGTCNFNDANEWFTIDLDVEFEYEGGNLVLAYLNNHNAWASGNTFNAHSTTGNKTIHFRRDSDPINPASPPTATATLAQRSNTRFVVCPNVAYEVFRDGVSLGTTTELTFTDSGFDISAQHTWSVRTICDDGESILVNFNADACACDTPPATNLEGEYNMNCSIDLTWDAPIRGRNANNIPPPVFPTNITPVDPAVEQAAIAGRLANEEAFALQRATLSMLAVSNTSTVSIPTHTSGSRNTMLWDNTAGMGTNGYHSCRWSGADNQRIVMADDFIIPDGETWAIDEVYFYGFPGGTSTMPERIGIAIYPDNGSNRPGATAIYENAQLIPVGGSVVSGPMTINLAANPIQINTPGKYWISIYGSYLTAFAATKQFYVVISPTPREATMCRWDPSGIYEASPFINWAPSTDAAWPSMAFHLKGVSTPAGTPCPTISNLTAVQGSGQSVNLNWTAATPAPTGYEVRCDGTLLGTVTTTSYTHPFAAVGQRNYCVRAIYPPADDCIPQNVCQTVNVTEDLGGCAGVPVILGTNNIQAGPINTLWEHGYTQVIYTEAEVGDPGSIESIAYNWTLPANRMYPITVWIGHTNKNEFTGATAADFVPLSQMQQVFSGNVTFSSANLWSNIDLQEPFAYEGGNIVVAVLQNSNTYVPGQNGFTTGSLNSTNRYINTYSIGSAINPNNITTTVARLSTRPNIRFKVCAGTLYNVYRNNEPIATNYPKNFFTDSGFDNTVENTWLVKVVCEDGGESVPAILTKDPCIPCYSVTDLIAVYTDACEALLSWSPGVSKGVIFRDETVAEPVEVFKGVKPQETSIAEFVTDGIPTTPSSRNWPYTQQFNFNTTALPGTAGMATDGNFIYLTRHASAPITKLDMAGNVVGEFTIPGINNLRALTFDGTDFYGSSATSQIWKLDMNAQAVTQTITIAGGVQARHCAYDPIADGFWVGNWSGTPSANDIVLVSRTGAEIRRITAATSGLVDIYGTAVDHITPGGPYLFAVSATDAEPATIRRINLTTGTQTGITTVPGGATSSGGGMFFTNVAVPGFWTLMCHVQGESVIGWEIATANPNLAAAPTNLTANPIGTSTMCRISWNNPTQTVGGAQLTGITKMVVERNGVQVWESTGTAAPGAAMSYTDNAPNAGTYSYAVYAVTSHGNGAKASTSATLGAFCQYTFILGDTYGDGWNGSAQINISVNGQAQEAVKLTSGYSATLTRLLPAGEVTFSWQRGTWDQECFFTIKNFNDDVIFTVAAPVCSTWTNGYVFLVYDGNCSNPGGGTYNIYRDGELIVPAHPGTSYLDSGFDPFEGHEWSVAAVCEQFGESPAVSVSLKACACHPPQNLVVEYTDDCDAAILTWGEPTRSRNNTNTSYPLIPSYIPTPEDLERDMQKEAMKEQMMENGNGVLINQRDLSANATEIVQTYSPPTLPYGARSEQIFYEPFEFSIPSTWTNLDADGDGFRWQWENPNAIPVTAPYAVGGCASSASWTPATDALTPDNWLISPSITLNGQGTIQYYVAAQDPAYPQDHYGVYVSSGGTNPADFTLLHQETLMSSVWAERNIPVTGQTIRIAFRHFNCTDWFVMKIDEVKVFKEGTPCPAVSNVNAVVPVGTNNVNVTWSASTPAPIHYEVLRNGVSQGTATTTSFSQTNVTQGTYTYCVRAVYPPANECVPVSVCAAPVTVPEILDGGCVAAIVGTATTTDYEVPVNTYYRYSYIQHLYEAAELGIDIGREITAVSFEYIHASVNPKDPLTIYLGHTNKTTFASTTDWVPVANMEQVFTGPIVFNNANQWFTITFDEPFVYEGGNLVMAVLNNEGDYVTGSNPTFRFHNATNKTLHYRVDGTTPINPLTPPTATAIIAKRANTRFIVCPSTLYNIYCDGELIKPNHGELFYRHEALVDVNPMNPFRPHCWAVTAVCKGDGKVESEPIVECLPPCKDITPHLVFGVVAAADGNTITEAALKMVEVSNTHETYNTSSGTLGRFEFTDVFKATYDLTVKKRGYQIHEQIVEVEGHTNLGTIILYDSAHPPRNVIAVEQSMNAAKITWDPPSPLPVSVAGVIGYKVWRLVKGNENNEASWTTLTNNPVAADTREFIDFGWANLSTDQYRYAVKTCYSGDVISKHAFSKDSLQKWNNVVFTINVECDNGANPTGAEVVMEHRNGGPTYSGQSGTTGITFPEVLQGKYKLTVTLDGFKTYVDTLVTVMEQDFYTATLESPKYKVTFNVFNTAGEPITDATIVFNGETLDGDTVNVRAGTYPYVVTKEEYEPHPGTIIVTEDVTVDVLMIGVGIIELELGDFILYPNPATSTITVERGSATPATIEVYNAMGMHIGTHDTNEAIYEINVASLAAGTYFIRVVEGDSNSVKSFVKK